MCEQPLSEMTVSIDVNNGGNGDNATILVLPENYEDAKQIFTGFSKLTKMKGAADMDVEISDDASTIVHGNESSYT